LDFNQNENYMKYFSLFSGIGGFERGIDQSYVDSINRNKNRKVKKNQKEYVEAWNRLESVQRQGSSAEIGWYSKLLDRSNDKRAPHCVGYSEIDQYAIQIYKKHFPKHKNYGDITKIEADNLPDFDFLCGGFPCQSFSIAGKRKGFQDTRGTLFFDIARILKAKRPRLLLLENVKGLLSHDSGNTFKTIISTLDELGYDLQWQVLNSKNHGVPQNRERIFIIGHLRGTARPEVFPFIGSNTEDTRNVGQDVAYTIDANYHKGTNTLEKSRRSIVAHYGHKDKEPVEMDISPTLKAQSHGHKPMVKEDLMIRDGRDNRSCLRSGRTPELGVKGMSIRRLTPVECERLQGFPDNWTTGISDTQRYKCIGNAVTVNVIQAIMEKVL
jgi:DNA (cytosine-5)-methyltransferase 1